ncbi:hypothetical protein Barb4_04122 [Bacteroidales bacterium Barb4]|nr:hypothetical protein Barb4_04122 [Bacteroidales bacterium Barb4]
MLIDCFQKVGGMKKLVTQNRIKWAICYANLVYGHTLIARSFFKFPFHAEIRCFC